MKTRRIPLSTVSHAAVALALAVLVVLLPVAVAIGQDAPGDEARTLVEELEVKLTEELARTWLRLLIGVTDNPEFLESPDGEGLLMQSEALQMIYHQMRETLRPETVRHAPQESGRFQFVDWLDPGLRYRVFDTRTGEIQVREALPVEN